jgi:putative inorganic carbon (hco3(-)) transporter
MAVTGRIGPGPGPALAAARPRLAVNPWLLGCFAVCIIIGVLSGVDPEYGILGALGLLFAVVAIRDVTLGFVLFTVASFVDELSGTGQFSGTKVIGLVVFLSWLARSGTRRGTDVGAFVSENPMLTASLVAMLAWAALSVTWATSRSAALSGALTYALVLLLVPLAYSAIQKREHAIWVVTAFVVGALLSSVYGLVASTATSGLDAGRSTGLIGESNAEATILAASIPLLISLMGVVRNSARLKLAAAVGVVVLFAGLVTTLSREGLVSLAAVMVGAVIFGGRWRRTAAVLLVIGVTATIGYYFVLAPASSVQRVTMTNTEGRSSLWTVALRVFEAHPVLGVGNNNFPVVENHYINRPGAIQAFYVVTAPHVAHNTFLEAAADLGIPGVLTLLAVLTFSIRAVVRATRLYEQLGDRQMELISRAVFLAVAAVLASDFFVSGDYAKYQWLLLALCPALLGLARRAAAERAAEPVTSAGP